MSAAAFLEIVETEDGEVILRRADSTSGNSEPLVTIHFSAEARTMLGEHLSDIARSMIGAGVQMTGHLYAGKGMLAEDDTPQQLH